MRENKIGAIVIGSFVLLVVLGTAHQTTAQEAKTRYGSPVFAVEDPLEQFTQFVIAAQHWSDGTEYVPASPTHVHQ